MIALVLALVLCGCGAKQEMVIDYSKAVGVIVVNDSELPAAGEKVRALFEDNDYHFGLDAAAVYFFNVDSENAYAGEQNLSELSFGANVDDKTVGAVGAAPFSSSDSETAISAFYLFFDGTDLYFGSGEPFLKAALADGLKIVGTDYPALLTFLSTEPAVSFTVSCFDAQGKVTFSETYAPEDVEDNRLFDFGANADHVEVYSFDAQGNVFYKQVVSGESGSAVVFYQQNGVFLASRILRFSMK